MYSNLIRNTFVIKNEEKDTKDISNVSSTSFKSHFEEQDKENIHPQLNVNV